MTTITENIKLFSSLYINEFSQPYSKKLRSFQLLVHEIPKQLKDLISSEDMRYVVVKGSIGQGNNTPYPWIQIRDKRVSKGATDGFYVVLLISDDFKDIFLTLNQGSTIQDQEVQERYRDFVYTTIPIIEDFTIGQLPEHSLVKTRPYTSTNKGQMYEKSNMFYKKYSIDELNEDEFIHDLNIILRKYIECADAYPDKYEVEFEIPPLITPDLIRIMEVYAVEDAKAIPREFLQSLKKANIFMDPLLIIRFITLLCTKPFVILSGLSGSGKTKLAQAFAHWICEKEKQYYIVPVGSDWTNREPLLGYPNALQQGEYITPNGVLELIIEASNNISKPYFLILDEMNLSHVERYFADFLSAIESGEDIHLHSVGLEWSNSKIPPKIKIPGNLFIIGTVNVDETTYMFSPKVLDRAGVIEFRVTKEDMDLFLNSPNIPKLELLDKKGSIMAEDFVKLARTNIEESVESKLNEYLLNFFVELKKTGAEFGYRTASDIHRFAGIVNSLTPEEKQWTSEQITDAAIIQKLLPKLHGSRKKLEPVLKTLAGFCFKGGNPSDEIRDKALKEGSFSTEDIRFPLSLEKITRMYQRVIQDGFTSFAEA